MTADVSFCIGAFIAGGAVLVLWFILGMVYQAGRPLPSPKKREEEP